MHLSGHLNSSSIQAGTAVVASPGFDVAVVVSVDEEKINLELIMMHLKLSGHHVSVYST